MTAINLDDELCRFASEILDIVTDRLLTTKYHTVKLLPSQLTSTGILQHQSFASGARELFVLAFYCKATFEHFLHDDEGLSNWVCFDEATRIRRR